MDININDLRAAAEAGQRDQVLAFLTEYLAVVQDNKEGWLLYAQLAPDQNQRRYAYIRVLRLDPQNPTAREALEKLITTSTSPGSAAPAPRPRQTDTPLPPAYPTGYPTPAQQVPPQPGELPPAPPPAYPSYPPVNSYPSQTGAAQPSFFNRVINWIKRHPKETLIAGSALVVIIILVLILAATQHTNALLGRWNAPGGWIEFLENGTLVINQPPNVQVYTYRVLDDHRIEVIDSNNSVDIRTYSLTNNILIINNKNYTRSEDATVTPVSLTPARLTPTIPAKITPTTLTARPEDLAAALTASQPDGWYVVVNGKPVKMAAEGTSFARAEITSTSQFPKLTASVPVVLVKDKNFTSHRTLEIRTIGGGTGLKLSVADNLIRVVGSSNNEPGKVGVKLGDGIIAVDGREVGSNMTLANSLLVGTFGTKARIKLLSGTTIREVEIPRVVQVVQSTVNPKIEAVANSAGSFVRLTPPRPLSKGLNCYYYTYNVGVNTHNGIYCFVIE